MLDKDKIREALMQKGGKSERESKRLAEILAGEDLMKDEQKKQKKATFKNVKEVVKEE